MFLLCVNATIDLNFPTILNRGSRFVIKEYDNYGLQNVFQKISYLTKCLVPSETNQKYHIIFP